MAEGTGPGSAISDGQSRSSSGRESTTYKDPSLPVYDKAFFESLVEPYLESVYPMFPVITAYELRQAISQIHDRMNLAFVSALAAVVIGHTGVRTRDANNRRAQVKYLVNQSLESKGVIKPDIIVDVQLVMTNCMLSSSLVGINEVLTAWIYLREAITMASILGLHETKKMASLPICERARRQRLYWMLYIHERFLAIHYYRPVVMTPLSVLPERDVAIPARIHDGFMQLIKLFSLIDTNFINAYLDNSLQITEKWVEEKQWQLTSATEIESLSEMQRVDLIITQQWLRMLVWQMAMSHLMVNSSASTSTRLLLFPIEAARKLRVMIASCSKKSIEVHGAAILQKLFELAMGISDVISLMPSESIEENAGRIEDFMWIAQFLLGQTSVSATQKDTLRRKLDIISDATGIPIGPVVPGISASDAASAASAAYQPLPQTNAGTATPAGPSGSSGPSGPSATTTVTSAKTNDADMDPFGLSGDDPWLTLSRSVAEGVDQKSRRNSETLEMYGGSGAPISWIASLSNLSGGSQELLHNLEYPLQS